MNTVEISDIDMAHENTMVVCSNKAEHCYMTAWLKSRGIRSPLLAERDRYPIAFSVTDGTWTGLMDRALYYVRFKDFINLNAQGISED